MQSLYEYEGIPGIYRVVIADCEDRCHSSTYIVAASLCMNRETHCKDVIGTLDPSHFFPSDLQLTLFPKPQPIPPPHVLLSEIVIECGYKKNHDDDHSLI